MIWLTGHDNNGNEFEIMDGEAVWGMAIGNELLPIFIVAIVIGLASFFTGIEIGLVFVTLLIFGGSSALLYFKGKDLADRSMIPFFYIWNSTLLEGINCECVITEEYGWLYGYKKVPIGLYDSLKFGSVRIITIFLILVIFSLTVLSYFLVFKKNKSEKMLNNSFIVFIFGSLACAILFVLFLFFFNEQSANVGTSTIYFAIKCAIALVLSLVYFSKIREKMWELRQQKEKNIIANHK